jgi:large subunit ribosomal protein L25
MTLKLQVQKRDLKINNDSIREKGDMPAVFYGSKSESTPISLNQAEFKKVLKVAGESSVITLDMSGENIDVLIHDVSVDAVKDEPVHVDFLVIDKDKKVVVKIPLEFTGESGAVKTLGGTLVKVIHELEVEALPNNLPQNISVDLSSLDSLDSHISIKDLKLPEGVESKSSIEEIVVSVATQKEEAEDIQEVDISSIEVDKKGKKETEDDADKDSVGEDKKD